jgi:hypothetical protein
MTSVKCEICGTVKKPLFTGTYCPNEQCGKSSTVVHTITDDAGTWAFGPGMVVTAWTPNGPGTITMPNFADAQTAFGTMRAIGGGRCPHNRRYKDAKNNAVFCYDCGYRCP